MKLKTQLFGKSYQFKDVKQVLAKANETAFGGCVSWRGGGEFARARRG